jgi:hypothetical protein
MRIAFIVLGLMLLTSCASPDRQAAMRAREAEHQQQHAEALRTAIQNQCVAYGHRPGTDAFAACVQAEHHRQQADVRRAIQAQHEQGANAASRQCLSGIQQACWELRNLRGY